MESLTLKLPGSGRETDGISLHRDPGCLGYWRSYISISADFMKDLRRQQLVVDYLKWRTQNPGNREIRVVQCGKRGSKRFQTQSG